MVPVAIWGRNLNEESLYASVKLIVMMTNSNKLVVEVCYLYCYAIKLLINGKSATETFNMTKNESKRRADKTENIAIYNWIVNDIEASE